MLAEHDEGLRQVLAERLTRLGYEVTAVSTRDEALEVAKRLRPNLVLTHNTLERDAKDGLKLLLDLRMEQVEAPVIVISGEKLGHHNPERIKQGFADALSTPFESADLDASIKSVLGR
ncbi:MAG: response regulator [Candidatus Buchananbacteria bacterium]